jgi:hypothetical protein
MSEDTLYPPPLAQLLSLGEPSYRKWRDYAALGFGQEHVPALIRMATDEELHEARAEGGEVWAPVHAWRALGQLRAEEAAEPLLRLLDRVEDDDWAMEDLPEVYGNIGPAALPALARYLRDDSRRDFPRLVAAEAVGTIGTEHPDARSECVELLVSLLRRAEDLPPNVNGFIVAELVDLRAFEAVDVVREAYRRGAVDLMIIGDFQDFEIALGLRQQRSGTSRYRGDAASLPDTPAAWSPSPPPRARAGRNDLCPCGSGIKYKKCCLKKMAA